MNFRQAQAHQPHIIRSIQKDNAFTKDLSEDFSDLLRLTGNRVWIKYNHICPLLVDIAYHVYASLNNVQTLGEEYTGIIQLDSQYRNIPSKLLQLTAILLQFGGESIYIRILHKMEQLIDTNNEIRAEAKTKVKFLLNIMRNSPPFLYAVHKCIFLLQSGTYHISKRVTGINYILIRHWLQPQFSLSSFKIIGLLSALQICLTSILSISEIWSSNKNSFKKLDSNVINDTKECEEHITSNEQQCILCLETRRNTSLSSCGHLFCWNCILEWLDVSNQCPLCREPLEKSRVVQLINFY